MRISALLALLLAVPALHAGFFNSDDSSETKVKCVYSGTDGHCVEPILKSQNELIITVIGQGLPLLLPLRLHKRTHSLNVPLW
jgi:hypothetical protein